MLSERKVYPLSSSEMGIYLDHPETTAYNLPYFLRLERDADIGKLKDALARLFDLHEHAFMRVCVDDEGNVGKYIEKCEIDLPQVCADSLDDFRPQPFEILDAPLFRLALYTVGEERYLFFEFHHLVTDGTGVDVFVKNLLALYDGKEVLSEECTAEEYALKERDARSTPAYDAGKAYYEQTFAGIECSSALPLDKKEDKPYYRRVESRLTVRNAEVNAFVKAKKIRTSVFFMSVYAYLLAKMNMDKEALLGTVHNGRGERLGRTLGMFVRTFPFYARFENDTTVEDYLAANNAQVVCSVENSLYSFVDLTRDLGLNVEQFFGYQGDMYSYEHGGKRVDLYAPALSDGMGNSTFLIFREGDSFVCHIDYRADLYEESTVRRLAELFDRAAEQFLHKETLADVDLLSPGEAAVLDGFNGFDPELMRVDRTVIDRFYENCARDPQKTAVEFGEKTCSYAEVDRLSNKIANKLISLGLTREDVVSVLIPKSEYIVIASLGVLKSLAAYQPLDPSYPPERLDFMMKDAAAKAVILDRSLGQIVGGFEGPKIYLDEIPSLPDDSRPAVRPRTEDLFTMLYTSGTTGLPKGVMIEHGNVATMAALYNKYFDGDASMKFTSYASYGFDAHMIDLYPALTAGGTVCVIPENMRLDLTALGEYFNRAGVTHTSITTQVGRQFLEEIELKTLRHFFVGGEKLVPVEPAKGFVFHNAYGPSEGTVFCSEQPVDRMYYRVPIGKKIADFKAYVVDENMKRLPRGVKGELCIAGPQVARGYLNRETENKRAFIENPFDDDQNFRRMYRTGDVVRLLDDGRLDFIGRNDGQVKIRGFRVELTEVEQIIRKFPGISDVTVRDFSDPSGIKYIAAYIVSDRKIDVDELNAFIGKNKPPYMIPAYTMQIDKIPLNQNQKVNKRALPQPEMKTAQTLMPENESEERIYELLASILGHRSFGVTTDLYAAGLSSVTAIKFTVRLSKAFGKALKTSDLGEQNTVRALARYLTNAGADREYELRGEYPLTKLQEGVFVECAAHPGSTVYNIPVLLKLDRSVDTEKLEKALSAVIDAHPYLKMRLRSNDAGDVVAARDDRRTIPVGTLDASSVPGGLQGLVRPFDLLKEDLFRASIVKDGGDVYLFLDGHHIVFDGESLVVFMRELEEAYAGGPVERARYTGFEAALDEEERAKSAQYSAAKAYYEELLDSVDVECEPIRDRDEGRERGEEFSLETAVDKKALSAFLEGGATVNALWNAAFGFALAKFLSRRDSVYTTVHNGRSDARLQNAVGMYVHTLPVVFRLLEAERGKDTVRRIAGQLTDSMKNDLYPFAEISRNLGVKASVMFVYEGSIGAGLTVGGKPAENVKISLDALKADLTVFVFETDKGFRIDCEYNARYYEEWSVRALIEGAVTAFGALMRNEVAGDVSLLPAEEAARIDRETFVGHAVEDTDVATLFARAAEKYPDHTAVIFRGKKITYRELDEQTDRVAAYLQSKGVGREDIVSILVQRGEYMVVAALGALKAGAAYEPLDPSYPPERLNFMVKNAGAKLVIADEALMGALSEYTGERLYTAQIPSLPDKKPADPGRKSGDLFIVLYTSGTTGTPKGVMLEHRNLVNFCRWYQDHYGLTSDSVAGAYASFGFDADMMDLYPALTAGGAVFIIPEDLRLDLGELEKALNENGVTHLFMTTQMGRMFAENMKGESLIHLSVGGEALAPLTPPEGYELWNGYGPTECTIFSTVRKIDRLYYHNPIGSALWNYRLYVVDSRGRRLPCGALGELWIAGAGVGRGYLDLPEQTAKAFINNPFDQSPGFERVYRTGDVVRRLRNGEIDFIGRSDGQVKIRGFRIELTEVERVIREYPGVKNVTIQAFDDKSAGGKFLAAYVVSDEQVDFGALSEFIKSKKPPYMVPAAFMQLDSIPLNQNQKVNRRALPAPVRSAGNAPKAEPQTDLEKDLCRIYAGILGLESVGLDDNFFDFGGTSISAAKVVMSAMNRGYPVVYKDVFDNPTARMLARHITEQRLSSEAPEEQAEEEKEEALKYNAVRYVDEIADVRPLGRTLLTGATGFLGSHILKELLDNGVETLVLCRGSEGLDAETRLSAMMAYYFDAPPEEEHGELLKVVDGDVTDADLAGLLQGERIDTIINSAACVKHFAADDIIERINVGGVRNLIAVAKAHSARLIQISTLSVAGENVDGKFPPNFKMAEDQLFFGQDISNKYVHSKFGAEKAIVEAIGEGLDAKMIRAGNLMGRQSDGEFQINSITNSFIKSLRAYEALGYFPVSACDATVDFSPVDEVARAVVRLARTDRKFTVFHAANAHEVQMGDVIEEMNRSGFDIEIVSDEVFAEKLSAFMRDSDRGMLVSSLLTYSSGDHHVHTFIKTDNSFTIKALYRLGFKWPITDAQYLNRVIEGLKTLRFFDRTDD